MAWTTCKALSVRVLKHEVHEKDLLERKQQQPARGSAGWLKSPRGQGATSPGSGCAGMTRSVLHSGGFINKGTKAQT
jgi:hypothetical protein